MACRSSSRPASEYLNLIQNPSQPFSGNGSTIFVDNITNFTNDGSGVPWTPFDQLLNANATDVAPSTNVHQIVTFVDPLTGQTRLIVGDDQGVFTGVDSGRRHAQHGDRHRAGRRPTPATATSRSPSSIPEPPSPAPRPPRPPVPLLRQRPERRRP